MKRTAEQITLYIKRRNINLIAREIGYAPQTIRKVASGDYSVRHALLVTLDKWIDFDIDESQGVNDE